MRRLLVFENQSLDGFFTDERSDMNWGHKAPDDKEWNEFVSSNAAGGGVLVFGRITYDLMARFWPTPAAMKSLPNVAPHMNRRDKIVFSRTMKKADWANTVVMNGDPAMEIRKLKTSSGPDLVILGSGSLVSQLTDAGLIDEYQLAIAPVVLGRGRTLFDGIRKRTSLALIKTRAFANGSIVAWYKPI